MTTMTLIQRIDALLPQTQCGKCGHGGCRPYAEGIAAGEPINRCPPGGEETLGALARLLGRPLLPLDTGRGQAPAQVAYIREAECIGCTKCIQVCPVDAIVGAPKLMHTVLVQECTGCDLCLAPCPVDCIDLLPVPAEVAPMTGGSAPNAAANQARELRRGRARRRFEQRAARLRRDEERRRAERATRPALPQPATPASSDQALKQAKIAVAMGRAQLARSQKAFGATPSAEQHALLASLEKGLQDAEARLAALPPP